MPLSFPVKIADLVSQYSPAPCKHTFFQFSVRHAGDHCEKCFLNDVLHIIVVPDPIPRGLYQRLPNCPDIVVFEPWETRARTFRNVENFKSRGDEVDIMHRFSPIQKIDGLNPKQSGGDPVAGSF
jgi:hypothetical protein